MFGGLFGFVGMIIGVPTFAVIYRLIGDFINSKLRKRNLSVRTDDYQELDYVEETDRSYRKL